jgi:hypothetical protein
VKKQLPLLFGFLTAVLVSGFSLSLEEAVDSGRREELLREGMIFNLGLKNPQPALIPRNGLIEQTVKNIREDLDPGMIAESLALYQKASGPGPWSEAERNALYNEIISLSTLEGLQYFSASRKETRTFFESSAVIDGPESKNPLPDPVYTTPPRELNLYARQKDLTFGDNIYQYTYYAQPDSLVLTQRNLTNMNYGPVTAVGRNRLCTLMAVMDTESYLVIYTVSMAKIISLPLLNQRIARSFSSRLEALGAWFSVRADRVFF